MACYFTDYFDSYFCGEEVQPPEEPKLSFFVDRVTARFVFDVPKDDEEVLMMFAQFVTADQVH